MLRLSPALHSIRYTPVVGCAFLLESLYGSKYSAHLGTYNMPYVYVKTILLCASGHGLEVREGRYLHGLVELLLPSKVSQENLTKLELLQFVDAMPMAHLDEEAAEEEGGAKGAAAQADIGMMPNGFGDGDDGVMGAATEGFGAGSGGGMSPPHTILSSSASSSSQQTGTPGKGEEEDGDAAAIDGIASFVSATAFPSSIARVLLYDAVCTCVADGLYSAKEKERVALVSSHTSLSSAVRSHIEKLALQEKLMSIRKRRLLRLSSAPSSAPPSWMGHRKDVPSPAALSMHAADRSGEELQQQPQPSMSISGEAQQHPTTVHHLTEAPNTIATMTSAAAAAVTRSEDDAEARVEAAKRFLRRVRAQQQGAGRSGRA